MPRATSVPQAAAIAFRHVGSGVHVCLIRRRRAGTWGIPKGLVDPGNTPTQTALIELWEEAGVRGRVVGEPIGTYQYAKWGTTLTVAVYVIEVLEVLDAWPECNLRERRWTTLDDAANLLSAHPVRPLWARAQRAVATASGS